MPPWWLSDWSSYGFRMEMAQGLRALTAFVEDLGLVLGTHMAAQNFLQLLSQELLRCRHVHSVQTCLKSNVCTLKSLT